MIKTTPLKVLAAAVLVSGAEAAFALTPAAGAPEIYLYLPGSQANDRFFQPALCVSGTEHVYFQNYTPANPAAATNNDYWAVYCNTDGSKVAGLTGTKRIWISRRRIGASYVGIEATANGTLLDYLQDPASANCTAHNGTFVSGGTSFPYNYSCGTVTGGIAATASIGDVTPDAFHGADNVPEGKPEIDASTIPNRYAIAGHVIGIPSTWKLRNALQYAQVLNGNLPSTCVSPGTAVNYTSNGIESLACMPSLTKQQLASLFSGGTSDWDAFNVNVGGTATSLSAVAARWVSLGGDPAYLTAPADTQVHLCRRENGAGQQVAMLANIMQNPCLGASSPALAQPGGFTDAVLATSLGAEDNCMTNFNAQNKWALGIQTTERNVNYANKAGYRFIKIDGAPPTLEQVYLGRYPLWSEYGIQWMDNVTTDERRALLALVAYAQNPVNVAARNTNINHSFGKAGYVALSSNGYAPDPVWNPNNPVTPYTRAASGAPDACTVPVINPDYATVELR
ncbi:uncharacterized protein sS8_3086 [Methylocaldum marinum]|uniref:PBP domain-containing protein n=1 Tax=Methylocaldum marinum TaxID=1432792 RepID=A0A250KZ19_9GAMM|nr:hypothetical protein [Methylocaldum marinum]BBA35029.1 uncharacterized protein sS8_3086 [Methylocaldum marinum]